MRNKDYVRMAMNIIADYCEVHYCGEGCLFYDPAKGCKLNDAPFVWAESEEEDGD